MRGKVARPLLEWRDGVTSERVDQLAEEVPVAVRFNGEPFAVMLATPADLEDFAHGFALSERGLRPGDIRHLEIQQVVEGILLDIQTHTRLPADGRGQDRAMPGRSGCGVCGQRLLEDVIQRPPPLQDTLRVCADAIQRALASLQQQQPLNAATGAVHAAAWADPQGQLRLVREDVGRHNALDKLTGAMLRQGIDGDSGFALVSSRASYEMVTKAALAGIGLLAAISAPTALAVQLAADCRLTLLGFVRPSRMVIYSHPQRLR
ncbi:hypothetical protein ABB29_01500 [Pseudoxanthomonas dokdonensis]|uniref:Sulfur carrier protein FdhD n=1 Tax=Pseudoxanthomonas dokdonensis TaxID=344882 RepID=A0A0R0D0R2_9GAMM|nr:hypothetical protein ABB29_01500 [Pseudoxanthomonas dokdonensis]